MELDIFSGRPNPSWELRGAEAGTLLHLLDEARRAAFKGAPCSPPDLGYRGLDVRVVTASGAASWRVFGGCLEHDGRLFADEGHAVEAYLLDAMPAKLKSELAPILPQIAR